MRRSTAVDGSDVVIGNLPALVTTFVGRSDELVAVPELLQSTRIVTLTGGGGHGKTRLALEVAVRCGPSYAGGCWLAELASVNDATLVPAAVASALELTEEPGRTLVATLIAQIGAEQLLLVLDNCEQVIDACARLADRLLRGCPEMRIIATSREPLAIGGEAIWSVQPFPASSPAATTAELSTSDAIRLCRRPGSARPTGLQALRRQRW